MASQGKPRLSGADIDRLVVKHIDLRIESLTNRRIILESGSDPLEIVSWEKTPWLLAHLIADVDAEILALRRALATIKRERRNIGPTQKWYKEEFWGEVEPDAEWKIEDLTQQFGDSAAVSLLAAQILAGIRSNQEAYPGSVFAAAEARIAELLGKKEGS